MYVLDTNILVYHLNGTPGLTLYLNRPSFISIISHIELLGKSSLSPDELSLLRDFLDLFYVIPLDQDIAKRAELLRRKGISLGDAVVVATAWHLDLPLVTHDKKLGRIKEIKVIDPL